MSKSTAESSVAGGGIHGGPWRQDLAGPAFTSRRLHKLESLTTRRGVVVVVVVVAASFVPSSSSPVGDKNSSTGDRDDSPKRCLSSLHTAERTPGRHGRGGPLTV